MGLGFEICRINIMISVTSRNPRRCVDVDCLVFEIVMNAYFFFEIPWDINRKFFLCTSLRSGYQFKRDGWLIMPPNFILFRYVMGDKIVNRYLNRPTRYNITVQFSNIRSDSWWSWGILRQTRLSAWTVLAIEHPAWLCFPHELMILNSHVDQRELRCILRTSFIN